MYKIKNNVDLRILEEFDYEYISGVSAFYKVYVPKILGLFPSLNTKKFRGIVIHQHNREVLINKQVLLLTSKGIYETWLPSNEDKFAIKDLIEAGLVEEVKEKNDRKRTTSKRRITTNS